MSSFEEEFPSLTIKIQAGENPSDWRYSLWTMEELLKDVKKCCLDKEKVRKAIDKLKHFDNGTKRYAIFTGELYEELGL